MALMLLRRSVTCLAALLCASQALAITLIPGTYVRSDYLAAVRAARSTLAYPDSDGLQGVQVITVALNEGRTTFTYDLNFHEADVERILQGDTTLVRADSMADSATVRVAIPAADRFDLIAPDPLGGSFERVESLDDELRQATLAGDYVDAEGRTYVFTRNGEASFPDLNFHYTVTTDHVTGGHYDSFYSSNDYFHWGFSWDNDTLLLYKLQIDAWGEETVLVSKPFRRLQRSMPARK